MNIQSLDHLVITVKDIEASLAFYCQVLGMRAVKFADNRHAVGFGSQKINLHAIDNIHQPTANQPTCGSADICLLVEEKIENLIVELESKSITIIEGPVQRTGASGPIMSIYIRDPDMNLIELSNQL